MLSNIWNIDRKTPQVDVVQQKHTQWTFWSRVYLRNSCAGSYCPLYSETGNPQCLQTWGIWGGDPGVPLSCTIREPTALFPAWSEGRIKAWLLQLLWYSGSWPILHIGIQLGLTALDTQLYSIFLEPHMLPTPPLGGQPACRKSLLDKLLFTSLSYVFVC